MTASSNDLKDALTRPDEVTTLHLDSPNPPDLDRLSLLPRLRSLSISGLEAEAFPLGVWGLRDLEQLEMRTGDSALPTQLGELHNLQKLIVHASRLPIATMTESVGRLASLRTFTCFNVGMTTVPKEITNLHQLEELTLYGARDCHLTIPPGIGSLVHLRRLCLAGCGIGEVPSEVSSLRALEDLDLSNNAFTRLPENLGTVSRLKRLQVSACKLKALPTSLAHCRELEVLLLSGNPLGSLPEFLGLLPRLQVLFARDCGLSDYPRGFATLSSLRHIALSGNAFGEDAFTSLELLSRRRPIEVEFPRPLQSKRRAELPSRPLVRDVMAELLRLGARERLVEGPDRLEVAGDVLELAAATKQLFYGFVYPVTFSVDIYATRTAVELIKDELGLEEYECVHHRPYVQFGTTTSHNKLLLDVSDSDPDDPTLFYLDHDDYSQHSPAALGRLSAWLKHADPQ